MGLIFKENFANKRDLWVSWIVHGTQVWTQTADVFAIQMHTKYELIQILPRNFFYCLSLFWFDPDSTKKFFYGLSLFWMFLLFSVMYLCFYYLSY